ncbi:MAG: hypothetical protein QOI60_1635 [Actinomycetota bacterium]|nr:hypothetical protein [Actinomycetota bacterium]
MSSDGAIETCCARATSTENPDGAKFCNGCGTLLGASASSGEVRKIISALFCDLVGSTSLGEQHDPEVLRPILDGYFTEIRSAVERHGGRVIGGALVAQSLDPWKVTSASFLGAQDVFQPLRHLRTRTLVLVLEVIALWSRYIAAQRYSSNGYCSVSSLQRPAVSHVSGC